MPTYEMRAPNGRTYRVTGPAGATDAQVRAEILRQHPDAGATTKPQDEMPWYQAALSGVERGIKPVSDIVGKINPVNAITGAVTEYFQPGRQAKMDRLMAQQAAQAKQQRPNWFTAGEIGGQALATAPFLSLGGAAVEGGGALLARAAPKVGGVIQRTGQAIASGGVGSGRTAAQSARLGKLARAGMLAERAAGGAIAGAGGAALTDQDVSTGAAFGAGLPIVANIIGRIGGKAVDLFRTPTIKAGQMIREALGKNEDAARAAFAALSPDDQRLARQVLVEAGVEPDTFMALAKDVERLRPEQTRAALEGQAAAREARLAQAAGGATATEMRGAAEQARRGVNVAMQPQAEAALARADVAGNIVPEAERIATLARQRAAEQSGMARRMTFGAERAETRLGQMDDLGDVFDPQAVVRERGLAGAMTQRGETAAQEAIAQRGVAADMEDLVSELASEGMQPLSVRPIVDQLRRQAGQPGTRADDLQRNTLLRLAKKLEGLADENGVIAAKDLYQVRKTGLNDIVDRLLGSRAQPSSGTKERTASLLTGIRPMIDDAIEGAGGTGWKDYLGRTRQGFEAVNRQELAAKGAQLAKESPDEFIALMRGERPQVVEDVMGRGTGQYDIHGMALADPQRYLAMRQSAQELQTLNRMDELAKSGGLAARELMGRETPKKLRSATRMAMSTIPAGRIAMEGGEQFVSELMKPRIGATLAEGVMSGQNALAAMNKFPIRQQVSEEISRLSPVTRNVITQMLRGVAMPANNRTDTGY